MVKSKPEVKAPKAEKAEKQPELNPQSTDIRILEKIFFGKGENMDLLKIL